MAHCPVHQPEIDWLKAELAYQKGLVDGLSNSVHLMAKALAMQPVAVKTQPAPRPSPPRAQPAPAPQPRVYFIQAGEMGPIKIGSSRNPATRLLELQTGNPEPLFLCATSPGGVEAEQQLHEDFASLRMTGEWFRPAPELIDYVQFIAYLNERGIL
ncbi:GIY-YIG nuclease family protein [Myxococcus virescens]|uniref:T5orf172 domain-containing protein n=1 Tax=Myxococcus virescens TaxID=83456 RepID=A0A511HNL7_9BACT|nr:GIY-YIG nuclease family protein [Myxococcus virescens]GEL75182.1 hypothetical protein MVI01_69660 [Myxococcus virescens]SDD64666.1 T5orf172 domain-containing protein [Myxococcus virescens]